MSVSLIIKQEFLENFQKNVIQGRRLLQSANHRWADRLLTDLYFEIEKTEWIDIQKKHQLIMVISNSWWIYINSLKKQVDGHIQVDIIRYTDAYKRFFSFLAKLDDFYLFNNFATNLLKSFIDLEDLSQVGITKFINSFCIKVKERGEHLKLIELQILLMFLRKSVIPQEFYHHSMELLGRTIFQLEPGRRALFLYIILENVNINYKLLEESDDFVKIMNKILVNRLPGYLKNEFNNMSKISINERTFKTFLIELEELIYYLNDIGEYSWIIFIIKNLFYKIQTYQSFGDAVTYIRRFIDFAIVRNRFEIAFEIYDFLEEIFMYQTDLGYDNILIELWVEACKKFVDMKEKKYLLQSLEKLDTHLKIPQSNAQLFHYFYTCNFLWKFKSMFFSLEQKDFWRMLFYRALFEEQDFNFARRIIPYLEKSISNLVIDTKALYQEIEPFKDEIYSFEMDSTVFESDYEDSIIKQIVLRISSKGFISYRMLSLDNKIFEGVINDEYWNDTQVIEIFNDIFSEKEARRNDFNINEFGKIVYLFLPKLIREIFKRFTINSLKATPEIFFMLDNMTFPFELIYDNNFFLLKYASGYIIGEPPIGGVAFETTNIDEKQSVSNEKKFNVLIVDSVNSTGPLKWNEETKRKELIFPFIAGVNEFKYIVEFFNNRKEINNLTVLSGLNSTKSNIISNLEENANYIIHIVGNIFYSKWSPRDSFFLTNDNQILTFNEINKCLKKNPFNLKPFLFFNSQIYDVEGKKLKNVLRTIGDIVEQFDYQSLTGVVTRTYPIFNDETKQLITNFYTNLFNNFSQGVSLLKARQDCMANRMTKLVEEKFQDLNEDQGILNIDLQNSLAISSYILFGKPWKKLF